MKLKALTPEQRVFLAEFLSDRMHTAEVYLRSLCAQKYSYRSSALAGNIAYQRAVVSWIKGELARLGQCNAALTSPTAPGRKNGRGHGSKGRNRPSRAVS